jgi:hypothetical protein
MRGRSGYVALRGRNRTMPRFFVLAAVLAYALFSLHIPIAAADAHSNPDLEITVRVNQKGFFDESNRELGPTHPLEIPTGKVVRFTFVFDEDIDSLAIGDVHQIDIVSDGGFSVETEKIWLLQKKASVTFEAGEGGRTRYRAHCILDCIGMDRLKNLVIEVVGHHE